MAKLCLTVAAPDPAGKGVKVADSLQREFPRRI